MAGIRCARRRALLILGVAGACAMTGAQGAEQRPASIKKYTKERVGCCDESYEGRACAKCVRWTPATMGQAGPGVA